MMTPLVCSTAGRMRWALSCGRIQSLVLLKLRPTLSEENDTFQGQPTLKHTTSTGTWTQTRAVSLRARSFTQTHQHGHKARKTCLFVVVLALGIDDTPNGP